MERQISSSADTLLPSLDTKVWLTFASTMTGGGRPILADRDSETVDDRAAASGSTGIKDALSSCNRFRHAIATTPDCRIGVRSKSNHCSERKPPPAMQFRSPADQ